MNKLLQRSKLRILLSRTDNIGDVILTLPMAHMLKQRFPDCKIFFLARDYVKDIVSASPVVDVFLSWDALKAQSSRKIISEIKSYKFDVVIHAFPRGQIVKLMLFARIPYRISTTGNRWYHYLFCNKMIKADRRQSHLHEAQINLLLLAPFGITKHYSTEQLAKFTKLSPAPCALPKQVEDLLDSQRFNIIIHPLSNQHAKEWPLAYYQELLLSLPKDRFNIFITGTSNESEMLKPLREKCPDAHDVFGQLSLKEFVELIRRCDGLLAGSTGPLHMAASLGIKALGLFPPPKTINPARWAPLGEYAQYLVADSNCRESCLNPQGRTCACMQMLSVEQIKSVLLSWDKA